MRCWAALVGISAIKLLGSVSLADMLDLHEAWKGSLDGALSL
jgi:hypothetical protein